MKNENLLDQFFLIDWKVIDRLVELLDLKKKDIVLEIGAGDGRVTKELVKRGSKTIAVEIDKKFNEELKSINGSLKIVFDDALTVLEDKNKYSLSFNKIAGSLPSSIVEPLMRVLTKINFERAVFLVPLKFVNKLVNHKFLTSYFEVEVFEKIPKESFTPVPKTNWVLIGLKKKTEGVGENEFLKRYVYEHPKAKPENALREGLIKFYKKKGKILTKNQARDIVSKQNPPFLS